MTSTRRRRSSRHTSFRWLQSLPPGHPSYPPLPARSLVGTALRSSRVGRRIRRRARARRRRSRQGRTRELADEPIPGSNNEVSIPRSVQSLRRHLHVVHVVGRMQEQHARPAVAGVDAGELFEPLHHRDAVARGGRQEGVRVVRATHGAGATGGTARRRPPFEDHHAQAPATPDGTRPRHRERQLPRSRRRTSPYGIRRGSRGAAIRAQGRGSIATAMSGSASRIAAKSRRATARQRTAVVACTRAVRLTPGRQDRQLAEELPRLRSRWWCRSAAPP